MAVSPPAGKHFSWGVGGSGKNIPRKWPVSKEDDAILPTNGGGGSFRAAFHERLLHGPFESGLELERQYTHNSVN